MRKIAVNVCRLVLAVAFILSGFVKAVDPLGTQYKIHDYLGTLGLANMVPDFVTLSTSVVQSSAEFFLGICHIFRWLIAYMRAYSCYMHIPVFFYAVNKRNKVFF